MAKTKRVDLDKIPVILEQGVGIISRELAILADKETLTQEESKALISYLTALQTIYKDYRIEEEILKKEIRTMSSAEIMSLVKSDTGTR